MRRNRGTASFLLRIWSNKRRKSQDVGGEQRNREDSIIASNNEESEYRNSCSNASIEEFANMMMRSRSVSSLKGKGWSFSSPMKVFRQSSKTPKVANDRSPMCRG